MYKSAFLIAARQVVSDIKKTTVFTHKNAVECKTSGKAVSGRVRFYMGTRIYEPKNSYIKIYNIGVFEEILRGVFCKVERFGSFLEDVLVCGNQLRAMSDFFGRKSMSGLSRARPNGRGGSGAKAGLPAVPLVGWNIKDCKR